MRRTSLTPEQAQKLGRFLTKQREKRRLSIRALMNTSGVNISTIVSLERGELLAPQPDTLRALASVLELPVTDVFTVAGWLPAHELPNLRPYLRAKYRDLDERAIADLERYADELTRGHRNTGPVGHEDEVPD